MHISVDIFHSFLSTFIFVGYWLLIVIVTLSIVLRRRPTTYVVAWLLVIYIVPLLGIILYFALGETHLGHTRVKRAQKMQPRIRHFIQQLSLIPHIFTNQFSDVSRSVFQLCKYQTGLDGIHGNQIALLSQTEVIFDCLISDIEQAKTSIDLVFYIWNKGGRADEVEEALIRASRRGVICRVMLDSAGSRRFLKTKESQKMRESGVTIIESLSVNLLRFMFRRLDLRQHRKVVIIDNKISYTGSMNIVDPRFFKKTEKVGEWVDIMIRMDGYITALMSSIYTSDWQLETGQGLALPIPVIPNFPDRDTNPSHIMQVIASGPGYSDNMIQQALLLAIYSARHEIIFTTPYFVPSDDIFNAICTAAQRGVDVSIIIPKKK